MAVVLTTIVSLLEAAKKGDMDCLQKCIKEMGEGLKINAVDLEDGNTALHWACIHGHIPIIRELLKRGANVNAINKHFQTPLLLALSNKKMEVAHLLQSEYGAFVPKGFMATQSQGLSLKIEQNNVDSKLITKMRKHIKNLPTDKLNTLLLQEEGAKLLKESSSPLLTELGNITLQYLTICNGYKFRKDAATLKKFFSDKNLADNYRNHIMMSFYYGHTDFNLYESHNWQPKAEVDRLRNLESVCPDPITTLCPGFMCWVGHGLKDLLKSLVKAIHIAAILGDISLLKYVLEAGKCDPNEETYSAITPLEYALSNKRWDAAICLINHGAVINKRIVDLLRNMSNGDDEYKRLLDFLSCRQVYMTPNYRDLNGNTHIHLSILLELPEMLEACHDVGLDFDTKNNSEQTALSLAISKNEPKLIQTLLLQGAKPSAEEEESIYTLKIPAYSLLQDKVKDLVRKMEQSEIELSSQKLLTQCALLTLHDTRKQLFFLSEHVEKLTSKLKAIEFEDQKSRLEDKKMKEEAQSLPSLEPDPKTKPKIIVKMEDASKAKAKLFGESRPVTHSYNKRKRTQDTRTSNRNATDSGGSILSQFDKGLPSKRLKASGNE